MHNSWGKSLHGIGGAVPAGHRVNAAYGTEECKPHTPSEAACYLFYEELSGKNS